MFLNYIFLLVFTLIYGVQSECFNSFGKNRLKGTCQFVSDCQGAAFIGGCVNKKICCIPENKTFRHSNSIITKDLFLKFAGDTSRNEWLYDYFSESMESAEINTNFKAAAYFAQLIDETNNFENLESIYPEYDKDSSIGNDEYDDGSIYRGRGAIYLRGKSNYKLVFNITDKNLYEAPEYLVFPSYAFKIAAWMAEKNNLTKFADGTFFGFTMLTNSLTSSWQSLKERATLNENLLIELNHSTLKRGNGIECSIKHGLKNQTGVAVPLCLSEINQLHCGCMSKYDTKSCPYGFNRKNECINSPIIKCCSEACSSSIDLAILIDTSFKQNDLESIKMFLKGLLSKFPIGINETKVSLISFSKDPNILTSFLEGISLDVLNKGVDRLVSYDKQDVSVYKALYLANVEVFNEKNGMRPTEENIPRLAIVISNKFNDLSHDALEEVNNLKQCGVNILTINIGEHNSNGLATSFKNQFSLSNVGYLSEKISTIALTSCYQPALVSLSKNSEITLRESEYKFYKYEFTNYENEITIEIKEINGQVELFYSFDNQNPLDPVENLFPRFSANTKEDTKNFVISRSDSDKTTLYFSIKGKYDTINQFMVTITLRSQMPRQAALLRHSNDNNFSLKIFANLKLVAMCLLFFYSNYKN